MVLIEKVGWIRTKEQVPMNVKYTNQRVNFDGEYWYFSVGIDKENSIVELTNESIGIDVGIKNKEGSKFVKTSNYLKSFIRFWQRLTFCMDIKKYIKSKEKIIIISVVFICIIIAIITTLFIYGHKDKNTNLAKEGNIIKTPLNKPESQSESIKKVGPISGQIDTNKQKDTVIKQTDTVIKKTEPPIPHEKPPIEFTIKNPNLGNPKGNQITQERAINLINKFVAPDLYKNMGIKRIQIKIIKIDKVNDDECYLMDINSVRKTTIHLNGKYAVATSGKNIYKQDPETKEYYKYIREK